MREKVGNSMLKKILKKIENTIDYISMTSMYNYIAYARVSQSGDSFRRQENTINEFCRTKNIIVDEWFKETCSGLKKIKERKVFKQVFDYCYENEKTIVLIDSTDRFCRSKKTSEDLLKLMKNTDAKIYFIKENLLVNPKTNKNVNVLINYVKYANSEVDSISYRMHSGYNNYLKSGGKVGRKVGYRKSAEEMQTQYKKEIELLNNDNSLRRTQYMTGTSINTLRKLKKLFCVDENEK